MKIGFLILITSVFIITLNSCSNNTQPDKFYAPGQKILLSKDNAKPEWVNQEGGIAVFDGEKYAYFKGEADSKYRRAAIESAKGEAQAKAANSINLLVATQYAEAWETLGISQREDMERVREGLIASKGFARVNGTVLKSYTEDLGVIKKVDEGRPIFSHREVRAYILYGIPYSYYMKLRDQLIDQTERNIQATNRQKKLIDKVRDELNKLDRMSGYKLYLPKKN
ncbi:MAG: hypothetical protein OEV44_13695 [Spirochaetota bacterium]|nr:hypothetical protein [Spirochaetota bacterium]